MRHRERGFNLVEFLIMVAMIMVIAGIAIPHLFDLDNKRDFKNYFGMDAPASDDNEAIAIMTPLVSGRLSQMRANLEDEAMHEAAINFKIGELVQKSRASTPEEARVAVVSLQQLRSELESAKLVVAKINQDLKKAWAVASHFGFK